MATGALRRLGNNRRQGHKLSLWGWVRDGICLKKKTKRPRRCRQDPPPIPDDEHFSVAVEGGHFQGTQFTGLDSRHGIARQDSYAKPPQDSLLDSLIAAKLQGNLQVAQRFSHTSQFLLEAMPQSEPASRRTSGCWHSCRKETCLRLHQTWFGGTTNTMRSVAKWQNSRCGLSAFLPTRPRLTCPRRPGR